jgi:hypothetical protein
MLETLPLFALARVVGGGDEKLAVNLTCKGTSSLNHVVETVGSDVRESLVYTCQRPNGKVETTYKTALDAQRRQ